MVQSFVLLLYGIEAENMLSTKKQNNKALYFIWMRKVLNMSKLRVFGCLAYVHLDGKKLPKLLPRTVSCMYLSNAPNGKGISCIPGPHLVIYSML